MPSSVSLKLGIDYDSSEEQSSDQSRASSLEKSPKNGKKWEIQTENGMSKNNRRDSDKLQKSRQKMREKSENLFEILSFNWTEPKFEFHEKLRQNLTNTLQYLDKKQLKFEYRIAVKIWRTLF